MKKYIPKLIDGTDDQFKIYVNDRGTMLSGDQLDEEFVKLSDVVAAIEASQGDIDFLKFKLPKERP